MQVIERGSTYEVRNYGSKDGKQRIDFARLFDASTSAGPAYGVSKDGTSFGEVLDVLIDMATQHYDWSRQSETKEILEHLTLAKFWNDRMVKPDGWKPEFPN